MTRLEPGLRRGTMVVPVSKSHAHRVLIAEFLAGRTDCLSPDAADCDDIAATKRCLTALASRSIAASHPMQRKNPTRPVQSGGIGDAALPLRSDRECAIDNGRGASPMRPQEASQLPLSLDCGESGTTRRLLGPVVAALGVTPRWIMKGRLASRPQIDYGALRPGVHELAGDVSSQFVSGLLFALPLLDGDSEIRLTSPLASRGYVDMTRDVLAAYGVRVEETATGFRVPGRQRFVAPADGPRIETDWSGAAFPLAMKALGNEVEVSAASAAGLSAGSRQPDRAVGPLLAAMAAPGEVEIDVDECPDIFPVLTVVAAKRDGVTRFTGIRRLRLKESDRVAAMADVLGRFGVAADVSEAAFVVRGLGATPLRGGAFRSFADHRIAMSIAVGATVADGPVEIDDAACAAKSYPGFFPQFAALAPRR